MFDLSLAHIHSAERERDIAADLRDRRILKAAHEAAATEVVQPRHSPTTSRPARVRALGR